MQNRFPIYIPSYDRWQEGRHPTMDLLDKLGLKYNIVVRAQEFENYVNVFGSDKVLSLPQEYLDNYETCDEQGEAISKGSGPQRNFGGDHSRKLGYQYHWIMDDNINFFYMYHDNKKIHIESGALFRLMENFVIKYKNIAMAGPNYDYFVPRKAKKSPITFNTRIYSCNLIKNDVPFKWRGRYNEDTILSLDMLKAGYCTALFNIILQGKTPTQKLKGGNTSVLYAKGTYLKSKVLMETHPDVVEMKIKFHRWHHSVDYTPFKNNKLIMENKENVPIDAFESFNLSLKKL